MSTRRGFLGAMLAAAVAPAVVRAESLMRLPSAPKILRTYWDGSNWRCEPVTVESQITADPWYTPPERIIRARPYVSGDEIKTTSSMDEFVDRAVEQLSRETGISKPMLLGQSYSDGLYAASRQPSKLPFLIERGFVKRRA